MTAETAFIPVALQEVVQPSDFGRFIEICSAEGLTAASAVAVAIREFVERRGPTPPAVGAAVAAGAGSELARDAA